MLKDIFVIALGIILARGIWYTIAFIIDFFWVTPFEKKHGYYTSYKNKSAVSQKQFRDWNTVFVHDLNNQSKKIEEIEEDIVKLHKFTNDAVIALDNDIQGLRSLYSIEKDSEQTKTTEE